MTAWTCPKGPHSSNILVPYDLTALHLYLLVKPLPVAAALHAALAWATLGAGVEAAHAVHVQAVARVLVVGQQSAFVVVHPDLSARGDSRHSCRERIKALHLRQDWFGCIVVSTFLDLLLRFFFDSHDAGCLLKPDGCRSKNSFSLEQDLN